MKKHDDILKAMDELRTSRLCLMCLVDEMKNTPPEAVKGRDEVVINSWEIVMSNVAGWIRAETKELDSIREQLIDMVFAIK